MSDRLASWLDGVGHRAALDALMDAAPDMAIFVVDGERRVLHWNKGAEKIYGYTAAEVVGENCRMSNRCATCIERCGLSTFGRFNNVPIHLFRKDGEAIGLRKSGRAFFDEEGNFQGGIEVLVPDASVDSQAVLATAGDAKTSMNDITNFHGILSRDSSMRRVFDVARSVARGDAPVLLWGESGTGKELLARAIHQESNRRDRPFVAVNCAALSPSLLESELFGHARGAFTGAVTEHAGVFERASYGTLFLDEVAELPLQLQAKLLRVLEDGSYTPVGGSKEQKADVRIVSATHRSLPEEVERGRFRHDLMFRLRVVPITIPPLRARREDITMILRALLEKHNSRGAHRILRIAPDAMRRLLDHPWPGNVRELYNVVEYAFAVAGGEVLRLSDLPPEFREPKRPPLAQPPAPPPAAPPTTDEKGSILRALDQAGGHVGRAADLLGVSRPTLWRRRRKYGI